MKSRISLLAVLSTGMLLGGLFLSGCGVTSGAIAFAPSTTAVATATYLPPIVATATRKPSPTPTKVPTAPPPPRPTGTPPPGPSPLGGVPHIGGQLILVSLTQQWLWAYQDRHLLYDTPVTTGMPELATPTGTFHVQYKQTNITFYSPWPQGSPYYYAPEHINYAMYFLDVGYYIHDAPWRHAFGPGTNYPHTDPDGTKETGSHGCVNVPTPAGAWLYNWAADGATIVINGTTPIGPTPTPTKAPPTATP